MESLSYPGSEGVFVNPDQPPGSVPVQRPEPIVRADRLEFLIWDVADFDAQETFLRDFGMHTLARDEDTLYMRGYGTAPYLYAGHKANKTAFVGVGFCVNTRDELDTLAAATGQSIEALQRPGGGSAVVLQSPNGLRIEVCHGIAPVDPIETRSEVLVPNTPSHKPRVNQGQRPALQPSPVMKLGHVVIGVNRFDEAAQWFMRHLGLIPTDVLCIADGSPASYFMRLDRGDQPADHHALVLGKGVGEGYMHSAYEVLDIDAIAQGQQYLTAKKYKHVWGIGRHILGSQLFDYWNDPGGFEFEHYADGDVFTADHPTHYHPLDPGNVYAWGPDMPDSVLKPGPKQLLQVLRGIFKRDIRIGWLKTALKSVGRPARPWL